jgi:dinuclear metal center YbgI/SA1388 family protein
MKIKDIAKLFEEKFPLSYAFDGDNVGLITGDTDQEVTKVLLTCDVDEDVVKEAIDIGANLIFSHHPLMFNPISRMTEADSETRAIRLMIKNGISHYSAHTNLDTAVGGLNDYMAALLGMEDTEVIDKVCADERGIAGYGRMCTLKTPMTLKDLMDNVIKIFGADGLRYTGELDGKVQKLAINTGGGAGIIQNCLDKGCDTLITGDVKYNGYLDALACGLKIVDIMHFDSEKICMELFESWFLENIPSLKTYKSKANINKIKTYHV